MTMRHVLHQLIEALPESGAWPADKRERWIKAMVEALDYTIEVAK